MDDIDTNKKTKDQIFIKKMRDLGIEPEDYSKKWKIIGKLDNETCYKIIMSKQYEFLRNRLPNHTDKCFCTQKNLVHNYYIYCKDLDIILTVGSECVTKVGDTVRFKRCDICTTEHRNTSDNYCTPCRNKIKKEKKEKEEEEKKLKQQEEEEEEKLEQLIVELAKKFKECRDCKCKTNGKFDRCKKCYYNFKCWNYNISDFTNRY